MSVVFAPEAARDIEDIGDYIHTENPVAALKFVAELHGRCERIAHTPRGGTLRPELWRGLRSVPFRRYVIFYTVADDDTVRVERVLHGARDIETALGESG